MIRDVASGKAGGIGPVRYVESGKTVNIPVGYVVEGGKTVLMYSENSYYKPSGQKPYYLYNEGVTADIVGGWATITDFDSYIAEGGDVTYVNYSDSYIEMHKDAGSGGSAGTFRTGNKIDLSAYSTLHIELEGESTILDDGIDGSFIYVICDVGDSLNLSWRVANYNQMDKTRYTSSTNISDLNKVQGYLWLNFSMIVKQAATIKIHKIWLE